MPIYTASWFTRFPPGFTRVGISRGVPRKTTKGYYRIRVLEPGPWFKSVTPEKYLELYGQILSKLDPQEVADALFHCGENPVMLCYESPADVRAGTKWCHRHLAAKWLEDTLGIKVEEVGHPDLDRFAFLRKLGIDEPKYERKPKIQPDLLMAG
jgi:hypothetical protein